MLSLLSSSPSSLSFAELEFDLREKEGVKMSVSDQQRLLGDPRWMDPAGECTTIINLGRIFNFVKILENLAHRRY